MRRIVACAGLWAGVFGWSESADPSLSVPVCPRPCAGGKANQNSIMATRAKNWPNNARDLVGLWQPAAVRVSSGFLIAVIIAARFLRSPKVEVKRRINTFPRHNTWLNNDPAVYRSILSTTWLEFSFPRAARLLALLELCFSDRVTQEPGLCAACHRPFATRTSVP
jgi:hypothetical protein